MIRRSEARVKRSAATRIEIALQNAFLDAKHKFFAQYGREPNWDFVIIQGGFSTTECIIELIEEEWS